MKKILFVAALGVFAAGTAHAGGYRIPEQSINGVALSNAYIAHTQGPDTAYYNPANMGWQEDRWQIEASVSYINLPSISYTDSRTANYNGSTKTENIFIPMFHAVSPDYNNFRFGFSFVVPFGLSKRWDEPFQKSSAEEFTLNIFEANPSLSYKFCDQFSFAVGARLMHTTNNKVKSQGLVAPGITASREMDGDSTDLGYNLAMTIKPTSQWNVAATYRSKVDMYLSGTADLYTSLGSSTYNGEVSLKVVTPAVLTLSTSYTFDKTTVELTWDKTYWSEYEGLDFQYDVNLATINPVLFAAFDSNKIKTWENSDSYRIGITHKCTDQLTAMLGFGYDRTPIPNNTLGFELPGSDAYLYSIGGRYQMNDNLELGAAYLYDYKKKRTISADDANIYSVDGKFEDAGAHVLTIGMIYKY